MRAEGEEHAGRLHDPWVAARDAAKRSNRRRVFEVGVRLHESAVRSGCPECRSLGVRWESQFGLDISSMNHESGLTSDLDEKGTMHLQRIWITLSQPGTAATTRLPDDALLLPIDQLRNGSLAEMFTGQQLRLRARRPGGLEAWGLCPSASARPRGATPRWTTCCSRWPGAAVPVETKSTASGWTGRHYPTPPLVRLQVISCV